MKLDSEEEFAFTALKMVLVSARIPDHEWERMTTMYRDEDDTPHPRYQEIRTKFKDILKKISPNDGTSAWSAFLNEASLRSKMTTGWT